MEKMDDFLEEVCIDIEFKDMHSQDMGRALIIIIY